MKKILFYIFTALDTHTKGGASARKLSAFMIMLCIIATHIKWITLGDFNNLEMVLTIDFAFIAGALGMTTYETITKMREDNKQANIETKEENKQENIVTKEGNKQTNIENG